MSYIFTLKNKEFKFEKGGLDEKQDGDLKLFTENINELELLEIVKQYRTGELNKFLNKFEKNYFLLVVFDETKNEFFIYNDHFGSNEIFWYESEGGVTVSDDVKMIFREDELELKIDKTRVYEVLTFYTIMPPKTIYKQISSLAMASFLKYDGEKVNYKKFWQVHELFQNKNNNYSSIVNESRKALLESMKESAHDKTCVSLSGGVDSGGLLGMLAEMKKDKVNVVSIGPYGKESGDLVTARKSAEQNSANHIEIYPELKDLKKMPEFVRGLNQPIDGHLMLPNCLIVEEVQRQGDRKLLSGFGAEMLLGNLKVCKIARYLNLFESVLPFFIVKLLYKLVSKIFRLSENQIDFLMQKNWIDRFFNTRGTLLVKEKKNYIKYNDESFVSLKKEFEKVLDFEKSTLNDNLVLLYLFSWVSYMQMRDFRIIGKKYGVFPSIPFDTVKVVKHLFRTPDKFRRKNKWNKQIIRDIFKPYVSEELYTRKAKSLIIPYSKWFKNDFEKYIDYAESSKVFEDVIDFEKYRKDFWNLPEPGLSLMRLITLALWYDVNWDEKNLKNFSV